MAWSGCARSLIPIFVAVVLSPAASHAQRPPVEAFGNLPLIDDMQISPDGKYIAVLRRLEGRRVVAVTRLRTANAKLRVFKYDDGTINRMEWANADRLLISIERQARARVGTGERDYTRLVSASASSGKAKLLFRRPSRLHYTSYLQVSSWVVGRLPGDPDHVLMAFRDKDQDFNLYKVNVESGRLRLVAGGSRATWNWKADRTADRVIRYDIYWNSAKEKILARLPGADWKKIVEHDLGEDFDFVPLTFSSRPNILYVKARKDDREAVYEYDLTTNKIGKLVFVHPEADVDWIEMDRQTGKLIAAHYFVNEPEVHYFDKERGALQAKLDRSFPGTSVNRIISSTDDRTAHIIAISGSNKPTRYFFFDTAKNQAIEIGQAYPALTGVKLGEVRKLSYKAQDGLAIPAYLTLPHGVVAKTLPLVVMPHGGPASRNTMTFNYWAQFLANRGYAVLQPQFRGSAGFGHAFRAAGEREWGGKMQDDVTDGVKFLIAQGIADPRRICIMGGSYGGYAALMGAVKTPDLYKCAISFAGVSDLPKMLREERWTYGFYYWKRHIGDPAKDYDKLVAASPARQADKIRIPILLIHGKDDLVVPFEQSERMARALKRAGKPHKLVPLEGEDHYLTFGKTRIAMLRETEAFLARHLGGHARPTPSP